ncbi:OB-fold domain-containing protein [Aspergillus stella-maris]|uniref:OB-fold domain-containing protein n=1 Tax=Aspergillus stella-maris TaxID=1810926 RepID=UPI003CCE0225
MATNDTRFNSTEATTKKSNNATKHPPKTQPNLPFYPAYTFNSSPTNFTWVKLSTANVHRLTRRSEFGEPGLFFYKNHPIRFVNVLGVIVARTDVPRRTILTIDDSSGANVDIVVLKNDAVVVPAPAPAPASTLTGSNPNAKAKPNPKPNADASASANSTDETTITRETHLTSTTHEVIDITHLTPGKTFQIKGTLSIFRGIMQINLERFFSVPSTNAEMRFLEARTRFLLDVLSHPWYLDENEIETLRLQADEEGRKVEEDQARLRKRGRKREVREEKIRRRIEEAWEREEKGREEEARVVAEAGREYMRLRALKRRRGGDDGEGEGSTP